MHCFCITTFSKHPPPQHKLCWDIQCWIKKKSLLFYLTAKSSPNETPAFSHHSLLQQKCICSLSWLKNIKTFNNYIKYEKATFVFVSVVWECKLWFNKYWIILYVNSKQSIKFTTVLSIKIDFFYPNMFIIGDTKNEARNIDFPLSRTTQRHTRRHEGETLILMLSQKYNECLAECLTQSRWSKMFLNYLMMLVQIYHCNFSWKQNDRIFTLCS